MNEEYISYLRSEHWRERRLEFLEAANWECEECGGKANQVHHLNYDCLYEEEDDDVMVSCWECHQDKHIEDGKEGNDDYGEY